jgi:pimeloyl-ACP methyl ester carboxylesterase
MKPKRYYLFGTFLALLAVVGWWGFTHAFTVMDTLLNTRLKLAGYTSHTFSTDSTQLHYYRGGTGKKTVLLVHGFGLGGATTWFDAMLSLEEDVNFIVPDLVWFGDSQGQMAPTLPNQAKSLWALCDDLGISPDAIVGVSYGGFVAFEMLHQRPDGAKELLVVNSPGPVFSKDDIQALCTRAGVNAPDELFIPDDVKGLHRLFEFVFSGQPPIPDFIYGQIFENETLKNAELKRTLMRDLVNNADIYRRSGYPHTKNSIIWGKKDQVFPLDRGQELADSLHAEMVILEQSGHVPNPHDRASYLASLRKFLVD